MRVNILEIPFDTITEEEIIKKVKTTIQENNKQLFIATPNPEMLLKAQKNIKLKKILQYTHINTPDGIGILWASKYIGLSKKYKSKLFKIIKGITTLIKIPILNNNNSTLKTRITGADLMRKICASNIKNAKIFLLGGKTNITKKTKEILEIKYKCNVVGTNSSSSNKSNYQNIRKEISKTKPNILFVAFGTPKQEIWINDNLKQIPSVKIAIGIGGTFDFISGKITRAPKIMQKLGLEWLWRLLKQPSRIKRIYNATIAFPIKVIKENLK